LSEEKNNMVRRLLVVLGVFLAFGCMAQIASASINGDDLYLGLWNGGSLGQAEGPFQAQIYSTQYPASPSGISIPAGQPAPGPSNQVANFLTFCVQTNQYFWSSGEWFNIAGLSKATDAPVGTPEYTLSAYTAWVYNKFYNDAPYAAFAQNPSLSPAGSGPAGTGLTWAQAFDYFQECIWAGMVAPGGRVGDASSEFAFSNFSSADLTNLDNLGIGYDEFSGLGLTSTGNVVVINFNPVPDDGYEMGQNQLLVLAPGDEGQIPNPIPEPTTIAIWGVGVGLAGAAALRRRRQPGGRWSDENRQAIFHIIEGKR
jgi:hypothetical protein